MTQTCPHSSTTFDTSLAFARRNAKALRESLFGRLFAEHPEIKELFGAFSQTQQKQMLQQIIDAAALSSEEETAWLVDHLQSMASKHQDFGVRVAMYADVTDTFVDSLAQLSAESWSTELSQQWRDRLAWVNEAMTSGLEVEETVEETEVVAQEPPATPQRTLDMLSLSFHSEDPWDDYAWMRDEEPLYWDATNELWVVSRYKDVVHVSRRTDLFCSGQGVIPNLGTDIWPDEAMINLDGEAHSCQRALVGKGFSARRIEKLEPLIRDIVNDIIDAVGPTGECDLVVDIARQVPYRIICHMLGYPESIGDDVLDWTDTYSHAGCGPDHITEDVLDAFANFSMFHEELLEEKKANPGDDLLSIWLSAELDGKKLGEDKLLFEHNQFMVGGAETTRTAIAMGMQALMDHPEQMAWLREHVDDLDAMGTAVEEILRYTCPFVRMRRTATRDTELHGKTIKKDDQVVMLYPAANRDERIFEEPNRFDIQRDSSHPHLSFGIGKHYCIGSSLARLETRVVIETLLRRLPDLKAKPGAPAERLQSCFVRGLKTFPVVFSTPLPR